MLMTVASLSVHGARRMAEIGALLGLLGGLAPAAGVLPSFRTSSRVIGGLLVAVGFALLIYALHFGKTL